MKEHAAIKESINALMEGVNSLLIDTTTQNEDKFILFDSFGLGTITEKPSNLDEYSASEICSILYQYLSEPNTTNCQQIDSVNRGLFKLKSGEIATIEVVPINVGFHLWVRRAQPVKSALNISRVNWSDGDFFAIGGIDV